MALNYSPITLDDLSAENVFLNNLNLNFSTLATLLEDALSRSGAVPNQWEADQDANTYDLNNVGTLTANIINTQELYIAGNPIPSFDDIQDILDVIASGVYTRDELDNGALDDLYYRESEVDTLVSDLDTSLQALITAGDDSLQVQIDALETDLSGNFSPIGHIHDDRYYTEAEMDALLALKSDTTHTHSEYVTVTGLNTVLTGFYDKPEVDALLDDKSDVGHTHDEDTIVSVGQPDDYFLMSDGLDGASWQEGTTQIVGKIEAATGISLDEPTTIDADLTGTTTVTGSITVPTVGRFDDSASAAHTAWVKARGLQFGPLDGIAADTTLTSTQTGKLLLVTAPATAIGLPAVSGLPSGAVYVIRPNNTSITLTANGGDLIFDGQTNVGSVVVASPATAILTGNGGSTWQLIRLDERPATTDNAIARFDGTSGRLQNSSATILDSGNIWTSGISFNSGTDTLEDYESGSWLPSITGAGGGATPTYTTRTGLYLRIGDFVWCSFNISITAGSAYPSGILSISDYPFPVVDLNPVSAIHSSGTTTTGIMTLRNVNSTASGQLYFNGATLSSSNFGAGAVALQSAFGYRTS